MKYVLMLFCLVCAMIAQCANVAWDFVNIGDYGQTAGSFCLEHDFTGLLDNSSGVTYRSLQLSLYAETQVDGAFVRLNEVSCNAMTSITWSRMSAGDVISSAAFGNDHQSIFSTEYLGSSGSMSVAENSDFYLSFQVNELVQDYDPEMGFGEYRLGESYYGWVEFTAAKDGRMIVGASAVDLDGGAMIVGGGAVPEPTSTLLMLVGVAGLALRRKRRAQGR